MHPETGACYVTGSVDRSRRHSPAGRGAPARDAPSAPRGEPVRLEVEGRPLRAHAGESVAVALFATGTRILSRSLKYHRPRGFFCLEGHCGGCLMRIGGVPNLRACMTPCRDGLTVEAQNAYPAPDLDLLGAVDWLFSRGMNQHTLMTGSPLMNAVVNKVVRQLSGLGTLPDRPPAEIPAVTRRSPDVVVVGAGPAGLAAAAAAAAAGARTLVIDEQAEPGGALLADPRTGPAAAAERVAAAERAGAEILSRRAAVAYYPEDDGGVLAVSGPDGLCRVSARATVYATGGYAVNRPFVNNDRPGIMAARAVGRLLAQRRMAPGQRVCVIGDDDYAAALAAALERAGSEVACVDDRERRVVGARGRVWVTGVEVAGPDGTETIACDLVAVSATPAPASEGPRQHGCAVELRPEGGGFAVLTDGDGRTSVAGVFACGDVCGFAGPEAAAAAGARAGAAAARAAMEPA